MKNALKTLWRDPVYLWSATISLILITQGVALLFVSWSILPPQVPLFYSQPWGEEQLALKNQLFLLPGLALFFLFFNLSFSLRLAQKEPFFSKILAASGLILVFILIFALAQIVKLVT